MRLEVVRMVADWLRDPTNGVNAQIPNVPLDEGDEMPPLIPVVESEDGEAPAIYDATRHEWVARRQDPPNLPCLYITTEGPVDLNGEEMTGTYNDTETGMVVAVRYLVAEADLQKGIAAGEYTLRAVKRAMKVFMAQEHDADRTRNFICIYALDRVSYHPVVEGVGQSRVAGALTLEFNVRDAAP